MSKNGRPFAGQKRRTNMTMSFSSWPADVGLKGHSRASDRRRLNTTVFDDMSPTAGSPFSVGYCGEDAGVPVECVSIDRVARDKTERDDSKNKNWMSGNRRTTSYVDLADATGGTAARERKTRQKRGDPSFNRIGGISAVFCLRSNEIGSVCDDFQ